MSNRFALFLLGVIFAGFFWLWHIGSMKIRQGPVLESDEGIYSVTGTLLISPFGVEDTVIDFVSETKYELDMWMYQLTSKEMIQVFKNLALLGIDVDIVLENKTFGGSSKERDKVVSVLGPVGIDIVSDEAMGTNFVHAKTIVVDESKYLISTANLGYTGFWKNREYWFIGDDDTIAQSLSVIFDKDSIGENILYEDIHSSLLVCPVNCRERLVDMIRDATTSIHIQAQYIQDEEIVRVLKKKMVEGVDVRILVGEYQEEGWLDGFGSGAMIMDELYLHAKNILIDDTYLIMGSMNLSTNALDNNREIGIVIDEPSIIQQFRRQFDTDWKSET